MKNIRYTPAAIKPIDAVNKSANRNFMPAAIFFFLFFFTKSAPFPDDLILKLTDPEAYEKKVQEEAKEKAERMARRKQQENAKGWDDIEKSSESAGEDESAPTYDFSDLDYEDANYYMSLA